MTTERSEEENVFLRRYFFTERGYETDRMPAQKHFDVVMPDAPPEYVSDHLYCRYVDFLKEGNAPSAHELGLLDPTTDAPNTLRIAEWLRKAHPRTRLDACPMFFLAKQVLTNLMDGEVAQANQLRERTEHDLAELRDEHAAAMKAHAAEVDKMENSYVDMEEGLLDKIEGVKSELAEKVARIDVLLGERDSSRKECAELHAEVTRLASVQTILEGEIERQKDVHKDLEQRLHMSTMEVAKAQSERSDAQIRELQATDTLKTVREELEEEKHLVSNVRDELAQSKEQTEVEREAVTQLKQQVFELKEDAALAQEETERKLREKERQMAAAAKHRADASGAQRDRMKAEHEAAAAHEAELEAKISEQSSSLRKLQHDLEEKGTELDRLKREHLAEREAASSAVDKSITRAQDAAGAGDAHKAVRLYREAAALRPQDRELAAQLQEAEKTVQKAEHVQAAEETMREHPSDLSHTDYVSAIVAYKRALEIAPEDVALRSALQTAEQGLRAKEASNAAKHGNHDAAVAEYSRVLDETDWVEQIEELLSQPAPEPEPELREGGGAQAKTQVVVQVNAASSEGLQAQAQAIKAQAAGNLGVDESLVSVEVTEDGRVTVTAPRVESTEAEGTGGTAESKIADAVRAELVASGVQPAPAEDGSAPADLLTLIRTADLGAEESPADSAAEAPDAVRAKLRAKRGPYAYGRQLAECREAAQQYPSDPVVQSGLKQAEDESKRCIQLRTDVRRALDKVREKVAEKKAAAEASERQAAQEKAAAEEAAASRIAELEQHLHQSRRDLEAFTEEAAAARSSASTSSCRMLCMLCVLYHTRIAHLRRTQAKPRRRALPPLQPQRTRPQPQRRLRRRRRMPPPLRRWQKPRRRWGTVAR